MSVHPWHSTAYFSLGLTLPRIICGTGIQCLALLFLAQKPSGFFLTASAQMNYCFDRFETGPSEIDVKKVVGAPLHHLRKIYHSHGSLPAFRP